MEISFENVSKEYHIPNLIKALDNVSWHAHSGEVFGILGPNGAGKSTMLRVLLSIIRPESGLVTIDGKELSKMQKKLRSIVGYMPEERGLYQDEVILRQLIYFGTLKGLSEGEAKKRAEEYLERFDLAEWGKAKISTLSKGMSFKIQLIICLLHEPQVVILDEPFYGLDPVNIKLVREVIRELRAKGSLVLLSTHMMNEVEKLCDRIVMMYRGKDVLKGKVSEIQKQFSTHDIILNKEADLSSIPFIESIKETNHEKMVKLKEGKTLRDLMRVIVENEIQVSLIQEAVMPLENIFVSIVKDNGSITC